MSKMKLNFDELKLYYNENKALNSIMIYWYEGRQIDTYDTREKIYIYNTDDNAWEELQNFMKELFLQREEEYKNADYKPYMKVKLNLQFVGDINHTLRVDIGDQPDFNPFKEWIGDYIYDENPEKWEGYDMGQNQIFSKRLVRYDDQEVIFTTPYIDDVKQRIDEAIKILEQVKDQL
tara:strand:+ start:134 stop:664 length:531 start_codon:yes stop_codon:yes gene_type:complete